MWRSVGLCVAPASKTGLEEMATMGLNGLQVGVVGCEVMLLPFNTRTLCVLPGKLRSTCILTACMYAKRVNESVTVTRSELVMYSSHYV